MGSHWWTGLRAVVARKRNGLVLANQHTDSPRRGHRAIRKDPYEAHRALSCSHRPRRLYFRRWNARWHRHRGKLRTDGSQCRYRSGRGAFESNRRCWTRRDRGKWRGCSGRSGCTRRRGHEPRARRWSRDRDAGRWQLRSGRERSGRGRRGCSRSEHVCSWRRRSRSWQRRSRWRCWRSCGRRRHRSGGHGRQHDGNGDCPVHDGQL